MKKVKSLLLVAVMAITFSSCYTLNHTVGNGAQTGVTMQQKQWYALWGAVPLNDVDTKAMAGGATDYNIKSQIKFVDYVISAFTSIVTINVQTVEVTK